MEDRLKNVILPHLPADKILDAYRAAPGRELEEKFASPESSSALVANTFGAFIDAPADLPPLPGLETIDWPAAFVGIEQCLRFPWKGGLHPWLDAVIETDRYLIGVESKRYEPFRGKHQVEFSPAYDRPVWGDRMGAYERLRDELKASPELFIHLHAAQLVKHAFAIRTQAARRGKIGVLLYLYSEPATWLDGRRIEESMRTRHTKEVEDFRARTEGDEVRFAICTYRQLLCALNTSPLEHVKYHAHAVEEKFRLW